MGFEPTTSRTTTKSTSRRGCWYTTYSQFRGTMTTTITAHGRIWPHLPTPARSQTAPRGRTPDCSLSSRPREPQQRYDHAPPRPDPAPAGTDGSGGSQQLSRRIARGCQLVRCPASSPPDRLDHSLPAAPCRAARSALPNCVGTENQGGACGAAGPASAPGSAVERPARRTPGHATAGAARSARLPATQLGGV
jgi:hypothetical protein